ncbi:MAG: DJ-1/PfpI family protein [Bacteroidota bacterium]
MNKKRNIGILIFDNAEVLDFAGPFEIFAVTSELNDHKLFNVFTVGESIKPISAVNGLSVNPKYDFNTCPHIDVLIISGGSGTRQQMGNKNMLDWINKIHQETEYTLSICSGSRLLGALSLLDDQPYCTHHEVYNHMDEIVPTGLPQKDKRYVQAGKIFTSGGISAGIDLSIHVVEKLHGEKTAKRTTDYMEYNRVHF